MTKSGITKRWLLTTILVIAVILLLIDTGIIFFLKNYYYSTVERKLQSLGQSSAVADFFSSYIGASNDVFSSRANEYVENFTDINVSEVWVLNKNGEVIVTSTGFIPDSPGIPDYALALDSSTGRSFWTGPMPSGEKVMAMTTLLPLTSSRSNGAVRYMISLELVDRQIVKLADYDKPASLGVSITKSGLKEVLAGDRMLYRFTVANTSNVALSDFFWHDKIPYDATSAVAVTTGTTSADDFARYSHIAILSDGCCVVSYRPILFLSTIAELILTAGSQYFCRQ